MQAKTIFCLRKISLFHCERNGNAAIETLPDIGFIFFSFVYITRFWISSISARPVAIMADG
jgi:hypothetical protein